MANKLRVSKSGSGAPTAITPDFLGQIYIDEDTGIRYEATALTEGSWVDKLSIKEDTANKKTSLTDNSDNYYPTQKAVKTAVDAKAPLASPTLTGTVTLPKTTKIKDTSADHTYNLAVSELTADRTVTLPLLTGDDTFLFKDFHKATSAEINTGTEDNKYITPKGLTDSTLRKKVTSVASSATPTPTGGNLENEYYLTALAEAAAFAAPSGTPANGNTILIRIYSAAERALTWNAIYRGIGLTLPATTTAGKTMYVGGIYNSTSAKWDITSVIQEA